MASMNHPGAGPLSGVPLGDKFLQILHEPSRMNDPFRGTSVAEWLGPSQFDTGSGRVEIALVKHTLMSTARTGGVYKDVRPVSFIFVPSDPQVSSGR